MAINLHVYIGIRTLPMPMQAQNSAQVQGFYSYRFSQKCLSRFRFPIQNHLDFVDAFAPFVSYCFFRSHPIPNADHIERIKQTELLNCLPSRIMIIVLSIACV